MILIVVFLLSLSSLALEVLLTRVFSISQWNHLSFMVISIALFGFAASGTYLSILDAKKAGWEKRLVATDSVILSVILYSTGTIVSFITVNMLPLDYFRLPLEPVQSFYLFAAYLLFAFPFFCAGLVISVAYTALPEKTGYLYFISMTGSACGAVLPALFLRYIDEGTFIVAAAVAPVFMLTIVIIVKAGFRASFRKLHRLKQIALLLSGISVIAVGTYLMTPGAVDFVRVKPSPYKALNQSLMLPNSGIIDTRNSIRGRTDKLDSPYVRYAPGLSLRYIGPLPAQKAVFRDGDHRFVLYEDLTQANALFAKFSLSFSGYSLVPDAGKVLLVQKGGGLGIACAVAFGAQEITILEQNPDLADIIEAHYRLPVSNRNYREFLAQTKQKYHIIHIENWGASLTGSAALDQEYFFTLNTIIACLEHLAENGVLIMTRKLLLPPSDTLRLWATAFEGLRNLGIGNPERHIAMLRNWEAYTLVVSRKPLNDTAGLIELANDRNFDIVFIPDLKPELVNRYSIFDAPYHYIEINRLLQAYRSGTEIDYFEAYPLDIALQTDDRPFPSRILKWDRLRDLYKSTGSRFYTMLMSGEIVVAVVLLEAIGISFLLLALPSLYVRRQGRRPSGSQICYFLAVGAGFMCIEMYFIKEFILLFGDPVVSLTVVLAGILVFSGIGGFLSQRMNKKYLRSGLVVLIVVLLIFLTGWRILVQKILHLPVILQYCLSFMVLAPPGILAGLPFPLGMRHLLTTSVERTYAWTANGCTSVLMAILAAQLALSIGIPSIIAGAVLSYIGALICAWQTTTTI